ncbi:glycosyltransferase family 4 protein [Pedobacter sp. MW01-1-1]|uniref:glycosyltransferase family 4 protein n=1 Tax=Pedobacter sp. MW01-1-1 TaxID=3383027 RepID=UPI003FED8DD1
MEKSKENYKEVKRVLFLSADDFKEKSIQVIRKTPEAYAKAGWDVTYIVMRDSSRKGNYYYEKPLELPGVNTYRYEVPGTKILNALNNKLASSVLIRIRRYIGILYLIYYGYRNLKEENFDLLYGYEQPGSVAAKFIKSFLNLKNTKVVLRFQGVVFVKEWLQNKKWIRKITNFDTFYALKGPSDLCIMTNDGSRGDWVLEQINAKHKRTAFWSNGVDKFFLEPNKIADILGRYKNIPNQFLFVSVSRIDDHKRVDRCIRFFHKLLEQNSNLDFHYLIIGEGAKKHECEHLVEKLNIQKSVTFLGAINQNEVPSFLHVADAFLSMYESSNVGNPLLEAIRLNKLIITLDNGATKEWIEPYKTGVIYPVNDVSDLTNEQYEFMAKDVISIINSEKEVFKIKDNLALFSESKLWTWEDRFEAELKEVNNLFH